MKVLHLFSNAKWTGPAEPALNLCVALRREGVEADFACAPDAGASLNKVVETARDRGLEPVLRFHLSKHRNPLLNVRDTLKLQAFLRQSRYDLLHCHLDNDHRIAAPAAKRLGIPVVRSSYSGEGFPAKRGTAKLLQGAARLVEPSERALEKDRESFGLPAARLVVVPNAVDTERFEPGREVPDGRRWLGIGPDAFVVGIVARMQTHRRYEDFFAAVNRLVEKRGNVHVVVVGRGTKQEQVGFRPVRDLGLEGRVHFPGFIDGENYVGMLKAFDVKVFLVPGSDGTCRAVREAMAMGKPAVVADRGMLAEIVDHEANGLVCDGTAEGLFGALDRLAGDRAWRRGLGAAAREKALRVFSLGAQARAVKAVYESILGGKA